VNGVSFPLSLKKLPDGAGLHERFGITLHLFHFVEQFERLWITLRQHLLEIAAKAEVPAVEHERVDIAPDFGQMRHAAHFAIEIRCGGNGNVGANLWTAPLSRRYWNGLGSPHLLRAVVENMRGEHFGAQRR